MPRRAGLCAGQHGAQHTAPSQRLPGHLQPATPPLRLHPAAGAPLSSQPDARDAPASITSPLSPSELLDADATPAAAATASRVGWQGERCVLVSSCACVTDMQDVGAVARMCFLAEAAAGSHSQSLLFVDILRRSSSQEDASQLQVAALPCQGKSVCQSTIPSSHLGLITCLTHWSSEPAPSIKPKLPHNF